jgi:hypothetical protein
MPRQSNIKLRRDTAANWAAANPVLSDGEPGMETDTGVLKIGDGVTAYATLPSVSYGSNVEQVVVPPAAVMATSAESAWYAVNRTTVMRFALSARAVFGGVRMACGTASGNIETCVYSVTRTAATTFNATKLGGSGVVACPAPSSSAIFVPFTADLTLPPGQYGLALWCDNTTATFAHTLQNVIARAGWAVADAGASVSGAPATLTAAGLGGRAFGASLEGRVPLG